MDGRALNLIVIELEVRGPAAVETTSSNRKKGILLIRARQQQTGGPVGQSQTRTEEGQDGRSGRRQAEVANHCLQRAAGGPAGLLGTLRVSKVACEGLLGQEVALFKEGRVWSQEQGADTRLWIWEPHLGPCADSPGHRRWVASPWSSGWSPVGPPSWE